MDNKLNELNELESQIDTLLKYHSELVLENDSLRNKLAKSLQENAILQNRQQKIISKIKEIIAQIRNVL